MPLINAESFMDIFFYVFFFLNIDLEKGQKIF